MINEKKFINKGDKPTKTGFGEGVLEIGKMYNHVIGLGADITGSVGMKFFADAFPDRFISLGIAEQNCVGVAAGLALGGKLPVFATYGVFSALRTTDQIRISLCYNDLHVIIGGAHAGISVGPDGATHQALEDIAVMRVMPNMTVLSPCDATQTKVAVAAAAAELDGPVYLRFGREAVPDFTSEDLEFKVGKAQVMHDGEDLTIISTGHMTWEALQAAYSLESQGISARVVNLHTIKPIDKEIIINSGKETGAILTAEEHQITGGLGSAVAEVVVKNNPVPMDFIGVHDRFGESGQPEELMDKYGLRSANIIDAAIKLLHQKNSKSQAPNTK
jgi:transketolase